VAQAEDSSVIHAGTPRLSVIICTHNRAWLLRRCLEALQTQTVCPRDFEAIVIDNGSTDDTKSVVEAFAGRSLPPRYVHEPTLGLSVARNTGLNHASAGIVAYIDDDAFAVPQWAEAMLSAFDFANGVDAVAGRVFAEWEIPKPEWMTPLLEVLYTVHDRGERRRLLSPNEYFVGANMAFRASALRELGGFDTRLGRIGQSLLSAEETFLRNQLATRGGDCVYEPRAVVYHHIGKERLTPDYARRRLLAQGQSDVVAMEITYGRRGWLAESIACLADAARWAKHSACSLIGRDRQTRFYSKQLSIIARGRLRQRLSLMVAGHDRREHAKCGAQAT
jgi:glycosyltransferase involved in cell wall biosynthesis